MPENTLKLRHRCCELHLSYRANLEAPPRYFPESGVSVRWLSSTPRGTCCAGQPRREREGVCHQRGNATTGLPKRKRYHLAHGCS